MFKSSKNKLEFPGDTKSTYKKKTYEKKEVQPYDEKRLLGYAVWLLSRSDYTAFEITNKMKKHQPDLEIVQKVVDKLTDLNYINDERRATSIANSYLTKEAPAKLKQRLTMKGVDKEIIQSVIDENSTPEKELITAIKLLNRKYKIYDKDMYQKYTSHLSSRGFSWNIISNAIAEFKGNDENGESQTYRDNDF